MGISLKNTEPHAINIANPVVKSICRMITIGNAAAVIGNAGFKITTAIRKSEREIKKSNKYTETQVNVKISSGKAILVIRCLPLMIDSLALNEDTSVKFHARKPGIMKIG